MMCMLFYPCTIQNVYRFLVWACDSFSKIPRFVTSHHFLKWIWYLNNDHVDFIFQTVQWIAPWTLMNNKKRSKTISICEACLSSVKSFIFFSFLVIRCAYFGYSDENITAFCCLFQTIQSKQILSLEWTILWNNKNDILTFLWNELVIELP